MKNVAVIGAGIAGITTAYFLAQEGHRVTVFEQEQYPAMRTSFANGGQVSVSNSEVWNTWGNITKGMKWLFKKDAPLLIRPGLDWDKAMWIARFLYHTAKNDYAKNTAATIRMGIESRMLYSKILYKERIEFDQRYSGILHIYKSDNYWNAAKHAEKIYTDNGCQWQLLNPAEVRSVDPALDNITGIVGGTWTKDDWTGDIHKFCYNLATILEQRYGVNFKYGVKLNSPFDCYDTDTYDNIIVTSGVGSVKLSARLGEKLPIYPVKGYSVTINTTAAELKYLPSVSLLDDQAKIVTSTLGSRFRVAGTAELTGENYDIRMDRIKPLLDWVHVNFPKINTHDYHSWACLRPMTPNLMPIVKQSSADPKIWYNTGHGHLGFTLAPMTANQVVRLITESK